MEIKSSLKPLNNSQELAINLANYPTDFVNVVDIKTNLERSKHT